jgi:hypothetical protein
LNNILIRIRYLFKSSRINSRFLSLVELESNKYRYSSSIFAF